ncbi:MAG: hypothetical protein ABIO70_30960 [Pseudomonadota bacterium]
MDRTLHEKPPLHLQLPFPPQSWSRDRIKEVAWRAHAWLEAARFRGCGCAVRMPPSPVVSG